MDKLTGFFKGIFGGAEPLITHGAGGMAVFYAVPPVLAAFGHPLTHEQVDALAKLVLVVAMYLIRRKVSPA